ncbi:alpha/beta fold hydrolase [Muriicola sp. Z0-33]|uniref:alpha/beta fold hydrolase n=1 Tax=Muriicola sp. Z0-33 TaxID=2816957 RepID=UPI002237FB88|nr:alpha/beta hydrolase [Muriicola sp. Z0-33]MCW5517957.1 alpha/beta hydrolase [Muriicola sp. Z0-33]
MIKSKRNKILKISAVSALLLLLGLLLGFIYMNKIVKGSNAGTLPPGYSLIEANGYAFSTKISGDKQDIPVILLHGFPESSVIWKKLMSDLNTTGYYTIAPDQRGYSYKARPDEIAEYQIAHLAKDVIATADALGINKFHLIGHDWGSGVGWQIASDYPERLRSFTSLSVPHLKAFSRAYQEDSLQYNSSEYIRNFQTKRIPEYMLAKNNYEVLRSIWSEHEEEEITSYIDLFSQTNALTSAINWYRANYNMFSEGVNTGTIDVPVLFVWGNKDSALRRSGVEWTQDYVSNYYRFVELDAGHWLIQESYEEVQKEILLHLEKF